MPEAPNLTDVDTARRTVMTDEVLTYQPSSTEQQEVTNITLECLTTDPNCLSRANTRWHLTASTIVLRETDNAVLLTLHPKYGEWLQLGGHIEASDASLLTAAIREVHEESGLTSLHPHTPIIDINLPVANCPQEGGIHVDVRFLVIALEPADIIMSDESDDLAWFPPDTEPDNLNPALLRAIKAARTARENHLTHTPLLDIGISHTTEPHLLIEGDNLDVLPLLKKDYAGKVSTIYLDPPYNTGNTRKTGFTYTDTFRAKEDAERHSTWLGMIRPRLILAREFLTPTGTIMVSIDDNEVHHLRVLMDSIFGERNFIAQMVWDGGTVKNNARFVSSTHEYVLVYTKDMNALAKTDTKWREPRVGVNELLHQYQHLRTQHGTDNAAISNALKEWVKTQELPKRIKVFTMVDDRGPYTYADLSAPGNGPRFDVLHPLTRKPCQVPSRGWGYTQPHIAALIEDDRVIFGVDETAQPLKKLYLSDKLDQVRQGILNYPARSSTHLIEHMLGRRNAFNNPKNLDMIADLINLTTPPDGIVMDFFAGSGTTGHAVLQLNHQHGTTRQFILVTNNENDIYHTVTHPRIQAAVTGEYADGTPAESLGGHVTTWRVQK